MKCRVIISLFDESDDPIKFADNPIIFPPFNCVSLALAIHSAGLPPILSDRSSTTNISLLDVDDYYDDGGTFRTTADRQMGGTNTALNKSIYVYLDNRVIVIAIICCKPVTSVLVHPRAIK